MSSSNILKMSLFFLCFAVFLVHHHTPIAASALPGARVAASTQPAGTDPTQAKAMLLPPKLGNPGRVPPAPSREDKPHDRETTEEFQACQVSNKTYRHRERIPRADPCEMCVCVDSEMYCFWKLCSFFNLTTPPPSPPSPASAKPHETTKQSTIDNNGASTSTNGTRPGGGEKVETADEKFSKILKDQRKMNALKKLEATSPRTSVSGIGKKGPGVPTSTEKPTVCYVMGVTYKYGEVLPRDTGTCLECACSEGGRVSCSPKDCVSQPDLDYLSHNNNLDMFDLDTF